MNDLRQFGREVSADLAHRAQRITLESFGGVRRRDAGQEGVDRNANAVQVSV
ncbi:MAG: hypothetical protein RMJ55_14155 [Roseiflexaceae bacterium]|nr:hypothetical protein [Roseiflexaceae bacterium]